MSFIKLGICLVTLLQVRSLNKVMSYLYLILGWLLTATCLAKNQVNYPKKDWWENALIYQIYPRSFMDSNNDGVGDINVREEIHEIIGFDFNEFGIGSMISAAVPHIPAHAESVPFRQLRIIKRLEYLHELKVTAILLAPIYKSPMTDFGYDISDYYTIHHEYGIMDDFENLIKKAAALRIKVLLDLVPNHTSNESEWFIKSMHSDEYYTDWYIWANGHGTNERGERKPPNNWVSLFKKSAWTYSKERDLFYLHQFSETQPDLNFRNPVVVEEMKNIMKFWLEKGVAGLRLNSINLLVEADKDMYGGQYPDEPLTGKPGLTEDDYGYLEHMYTKDQDEVYDLVGQFRDVFDAIAIRDNMTRVMITEAYANIKNAVRYYGDGVHNGAQIPLNFALMDHLDKTSDARDIKYNIDRWLTYKPLHKAANWVTGNQDRSRLASRFRAGLVDAFNMLILLLPGIAVTYMGEELGMKNGFVSWGDTRDPLACNTDDPVHFIDVTRDPARTPFQWSSGRNAGFSGAKKTWLPVAEGYENLNYDQQRVAVRSHFQVYRSLVKLRSRAAFRYGRFESLALSNDVFAFKRWQQDETYIVIINVGKGYNVVNLTAFDLVFGQLEVEASSVLSSRSFGDTVAASFVDLAQDEALVLRMQV